MKHAVIALLKNVKLVYDVQKTHNARPYLKKLGVGRRLEPSSSYFSWEFSACFITVKLVSRKAKLCPGVLEYDFPSHDEFNIA